MITVRRCCLFFLIKFQCFVKSTVSLGNSCWSASREFGREQMRSDWNAVRVDIMYSITTTTEQQVFELARSCVATSSR
jgi:hypothetical protein